MSEFYMKTTGFRNCIEFKFGGFVSDISIHGNSNDCLLKSPALAISNGISLCSLEKAPTGPGGRGQRLSQRNYITT